MALQGYKWSEVQMTSARKQAWMIRATSHKLLEQQTSGEKEMNSISREEINKFIVVMRINRRSMKFDELT